MKQEGNKNHGEKHFLKCKILVKDSIVKHIGSEAQL